jgi:hypothetical protein
MINEVRAMNMLIVEGFKDIHFPFTEVDLTSSLKSAASRQSFLRQQRYVLSSRSVDLVQGGRHHHLGKLQFYKPFAADFQQTKVQIHIL